MERIWRREGLKVPAKQPKRSRLWLAGGSCIRLRAERPNHVWSEGFVEDRTHDGRKYRVLNVIDEFTREALTMRANRRPGSTDVIDVLTDLFILRGPPAYVRSDNGPEFVARAVRAWTRAVGSQTAYIEPGSPWENARGGPGPVAPCRSPSRALGARFRDELLDGEVFYTLAEARIVIEAWRRDFNVVRPHSALRWRPPAPETIVPLPIGPTMH